MTTPRISFWKQVKRTFKRAAAFTDHDPTLLPADPGAATASTT